MEVIHLDISKWHKECLAAWGDHSLPPLHSIKVTYQPNMTRCLGKATSSRKRGYSITLSYPKFKALKETNPDVFKDVLDDSIIHELAHISMYHQRYWGEGHGPRWQTLMLEVGRSPTAINDDKRVDWPIVTKYQWDYTQATRYSNST